MTKPTVGSLFSGIGGIDLGLERAGWEIAWQVENDPFCARILRKHWPHAPLYGDIRTLDPSDLAPVDLIAGGFPCQPVSVAGKKHGTRDERWLWPEFHRILRHLQPRWVLVENVPGLRFVNGGSAFTEVLSSLAEIGYDAEWDCLPAVAFGAPHRRYRLFLVAYPHSERESQPTRRIFEERRWLSDSRKAYRRQWEAEPGVGRVADGIPNRVERLKRLGNAVVPQIVEWLGRRILELMEEA